MTEWRAAGIQPLSGRWPDGNIQAAGQLSALYSDLSGVDYDFTLLNMHGAHGGNVLTTTLPGVGGDAPWMETIDADSVWRQDSATVDSALFRVNYNNDPANPAVYEETGLAAGEYTVYVTWAANVTQDVDNQENSNFKDKKILPAEAAQYKVFDGDEEEGTFVKNQRLFAQDFEHDGMAFALLGTFQVTNGTLRVELNNALDATDNVIAGPVLVVPTAGTAFRIQNDRDPSTLAALPGNGYSDNDASWTDLVYPVSPGNNPLWESELLRPGFRALFTDWRSGGLDFPDLGDATSPDPNTAPIEKDQKGSFATPFTPFAAVASLIASAPVSLATPCTAAQRNRKFKLLARGNFGAPPNPPHCGSKAS